MIARAAIVVAAVLIGAWLVSGLIPVRDEREGIAAVRATPQDLPRAYRLLGQAAAHTRSTEPDLRLAQLDALTSTPTAPSAASASSTRREPENRDAWVLLAQTARTVAPALAAQAAARARALSPPVPPDR